MNGGHLTWHRIGSPLLGSDRRGRGRSESKAKMRTERRAGLTKAGPEVVEASLRGKQEQIVGAQVAGGGPSVDRDRTGRVRNEGQGSDLK
jgi:hypothetical protein